MEVERTEQVKRNNLNSKYKWRQEHKEEYLRDQRKYAANYYEHNSEKVLKYKKDKYAFDKQSQQFRMILFE